MHIVERRYSPAHLIVAFVLVASLAQACASTPNGSRYHCTAVRSSVMNERAEIVCNVEDGILRNQANELVKFIGSGRKAYVGANALVEVDAIAFAERVVERIAHETQIDQGDGRFISGRTVMTDATEINVDLDNGELKVYLANASYTVVATDKSGDLSFEFVVH